MSEKLPNLCYYTNEEYSFSKPYSERTAEIIDEEVKKMVNEQYDRAKGLLSESKDKHKELADLLRSKEVIFAEDVEHIFGKRNQQTVKIFRFHRRSLGVELIGLYQSINDSFYVFTEKILHIFHRQDATFNNILQHDER